MGRFFLGQCGFYINSVQSAMVIEKRTIAEYVKNQRKGKEYEGFT